jgi:aryl-alcohol dehydrogenase-like predicted oxidoreductase
MGLNRLPIKEKISRHLLSLDDKRKLRIGVGCAWMGRGEDYRDTLESDLAILMASYEKGFRYYDTSRQYGESEKVVGEFVKRIPRETIFLATKSPYPRMKDSHKRNFQVFKDNFYRSFERLQTDYIDLYQIHDTDHYESCVEEVIPFLQERREEGLISYIGMATLSLHELEVAAREGIINSVLSYMQYSLLKKSAEPLISLTNKMDIAFVNAAILHYGLILSENPLKYNLECNLPHMNRLRETTFRMQELCRTMGLPILFAALQFSLLKSEIDITLNGFSDASQLISTLDALKQPIYPEQWAEIMKLQESLPMMYVQDDMQG